MLAHYISPDHLPIVVVWLDWNLYAYWQSLVWCLVFSVVLLVFDHGRYPWFPYDPGYSWGDMQKTFLVAVSAWIVWCAGRYGYGVG